MSIGREGNSGHGIKQVKKGFLELSIVSVHAQRYACAYTMLLNVCGHVCT